MTTLRILDLILKAVDTIEESSAGHDTVLFGLEKISLLCGKQTGGVRAVIRKQQTFNTMSFLQVEGWDGDRPL